MERTRQLKARWLPVVASILLVMTAFPSQPSAAQTGSRTFPETGKTVKGKFLTYWDTHGGLAQQGFPISEEMQEKSDTDGKTYTVQYFERAVFELHPENAGKPSEVLLSLLGVFLYKQKYPNGAPGQVANASPGSRFFPETGRRVGGSFLAYWNTNGALPQQGFPISEEFNEVSPLDGKTYKVQYFERAVFEAHPEQRDPRFQVLLSQLGKFRYDAKYSNTQNPPSTAHQDKDGKVTPRCGVVGTRFRFEGTGFTPNEPLSFWFTAEIDGSVFGTAKPEFLAPDTGAFLFDIPTNFNVATGWYAMTWQGDYSKHLSIGWFQVVANLGQCSNAPTPVPQPPTPRPGGTCDTSGTVNGRAEPTSVRVGGTIRVFAQGFTPNEALSLWFTAPDGSVFGTEKPEFQVPDTGSFYLDLPTDFSTGPGRYAISFQGDYSRHLAVIYFCVTP